MSGKDLSKLSYQEQNNNTSDLATGAHINKGFGSGDLIISSNNDVIVSDIIDMISSTSTSIANGYNSDKGNVTENGSERKKSNDSIPLVPLKSKFGLFFKKNNLKISSTNSKNKLMKKKKNRKFINSKQECKVSRLQENYFLI
jgi:hypothetical protein